MKNILISTIILFLSVTFLGWNINFNTNENSLATKSIMNVYFGTSGKTTKGIYHSTIDIKKGELSEPKLAAEIGSPGFLAKHPEKEILYVVGQLNGENVVAGYTIGNLGALKKITSSEIPDGGGTHIAVHPSGKFLLTVQYGAGSVALFPLDIDGNLGNAAITKHNGASNVVSSRQSDPHPHWCGFSPDGKYAFVPDLGKDGIVIYRVEEERPSIVEHGFAESNPGSGPRHMKFSNDGNFIYLLNELSLSVTTFKYDSETGITVKVATTPALSEEAKAQESFNSAAEIVLHPSGKFIFSSNRGHDSITSYLIDSKTAIPTVIEVEPIRGAWPRNINVDPSGQWLLSAGRHSNTISVHQIDESTGKLTFVQKSIINVPEPICILFTE